MRIFISYRRADCHREATMIYLGLRADTENEVFFDVETINPGANFVEAIAREVDLADVVLVLIGDDWLSLTGADGERRIDNPDDHVQTEVRLALERGVHVLPVLVEGAGMPAQDQLPKAIASLAFLNALQVKDDSLTTDIDRLGSAIKKLGAFEPPSSVPVTEAPLSIEPRILDSSDEVAGALLPAVRRLANRERELASEGRKVLERDLGVALSEELKGAMLEASWVVPGWDPQPGRFDLLVRGQDPRPRIAIETKLKDSNDLYESIWDAIKLLALNTLDHVDATYLVGGTTQSNWDKPIAGTDLYENGEVDLVALINSVGPWWDKYILGDSAGRPLFAPRTISVKLLGAVPVQLRGQAWEIRVAKLEASGSDWVEFDNGRPPSDTQGDPPESDAPDEAARVDTVVVAGRRAYPLYLSLSAYICPAGRTFRDVERLAFYRDRAIQPEVALIRHWRDKVAFTRPNAEKLRASANDYDEDIAKVIDESLDRADDEREEGRRYKVLLLSGPDDPQTVRIRPVLHTGPSAWTQSKRYAMSDELRRVSSTDDLMPASSRASQADPKGTLDFDHARAFIESVPRGRWTAYREVAAAAGAPRGGMAVGEWLRRTGEEIDGVWRVLRSKGEISDGWNPQSPTLPKTPEDLRRVLESEGVIFESKGRAHVGQIWRAADWPGPES